MAQFNSEKYPSVTPMVYKLDSKGVLRCWRAWVEIRDDGVVIENNESGIVDGKLTGTPIPITVGGNIGKKSETSPFQQACKNITSKYKKKRKEGYVEDIEDFEEKGVMGAKHWDVGKRHMSQYALHQPKLDGIRNNFIEEKLMSRGNKEFAPHMYDLPWFDYLMRSGKPEADGEIYIHGVDLNDISALTTKYRMTTKEFLTYCDQDEGGVQINLKAADIIAQIYTGSFYQDKDTIKLAEKCSKSCYYFPGAKLSDIAMVGSMELEYWVFDLPDREKRADERNFELIEWLKDNQEALDAGIVLVEGVEFDIADIEEINESYVELGFEGTMVRKPSGLYAYGHKSADILKFKLFVDAEWTIEDYVLDKQGNPTFVFSSALGHEFKVRPTGSAAWRRTLLENIDSVIGSSCTLRYQTLHTDTLIPQFARAIAIRNYE